jgi:hypothetical protein
VHAEFADVRQIQPTTTFDSQQTGFVVGYFPAELPAHATFGMPEAGTVFGPLGVRRTGSPSTSSMTSSSALGPRRPRSLRRCGANYFAGIPCHPPLPISPDFTGTQLIVERRYTI